jgi:hypothetical protein
MSRVVTVVVPYVNVAVADVAFVAANVIVSTVPTVPTSAREYETFPAESVTRVVDAVAPLRPATVTVTDVLETPLPY